MAFDSTKIELSLPELREVTGYAVACARPALEIFERERPDDGRPRAAIDAAQAFADGAARTRAIRDNGWAAHRAAQETRDAGILASGAKPSVNNVTEQFTQAEHLAYRQPVGDYGAGRSLSGTTKAPRPITDRISPSALSTASAFSAVHRRPSRARARAIRP